MRSTAAGWLWLAFSLWTLVVPGCGSSPESSAPNPKSAFVERFNQADAMTEGAAKNEAYAQIAKDAGAAGDIDAANNALSHITDLTLRETMAYKAALAMGKAGKRREAAQLLKSIRDPSRSQKAQAKIAKGDWTE
jgi:hypothetical protein